ncbi:GKN2 protein, partial [Corythaeola cristata]|nr:GKN2 protein [Corythaeola cristata]
TMTIDNGRNIAEVHIRSGLYSSDSIFDYSSGYVATRLFSRHACFILKITKGDIPELQDIGRTAFEKKTLREVYNRRNVWVQFQSGHSWFGDFKDWLRYGRSIERLCSGLPLYR